MSQMRSHSENAQHVNASGMARGGMHTFAGCLCFSVILSITFSNGVNTKRLLRPLILLTIQKTIAEPWCPSIIGIIGKSI
jgi:hypothetical protein